MSDIRSKGKYVLCKSHPPGGVSNPRYVSRALCTVEPMVGCKKCPHHDFLLTFQVHIGDQQVACPRWESDSKRMEGVLPQYVMVRREACLRIRPFLWCPSCPNSRSEEFPRSRPGWWEVEISGKRRHDRGNLEDIEYDQPGGVERDGITGYSAPITIQPCQSKKRLASRKINSPGGKRRKTKIK